MSEADSPTTIPPGYESKSFTEIIGAILYDGDRPFWVRRSAEHKRPWEVCYHSDPEVVRPVVVEQFYDHGDAVDDAITRTAAMLKELATHTP